MLFVCPAACLLAQTPPPSPKPITGTTPGQPTVNLTIENPPAPPPAGRVARTPAVDDAPVPPAPIPNAGGQRGQRTNSFLDKIFGTL